jgi:hypothetical protein
MAASCERANEPSYFIKDGEFLDQLSDYGILMKDLASVS